VARRLHFPSLICRHRQAPNLSKVLLQRVPRRQSYHIEWGRCASQQSFSHLCRLWVISVISNVLADVRFTPESDQTCDRGTVVPKPDVSNRSKTACCSITSSAVASKEGGTETPSVLAVLMLITSSAPLLSVTVKVKPASHGIRRHLCRLTLLEAPAPRQQFTILEVSTVQREWESRIARGSSPARLL